ncbi:helicase-related protein [Chitinivibrio alkaliphilus]|nr:helicase-related protein [Chitinivibrio alkaliphilus]
MYGFLEERISQGEKVFWIIPRIDEDIRSSRMDLEKRKAILQEQLPQQRVSWLHGKMPPREKEAILQDFATGPAGILLATTVIEVGVDIPEATVMVIENSECFGLAQLHQLRGRVGRSSLKSWCFLLCGAETSPTSVERLHTFCSTHDGFTVAEQDLMLRGTGEVLGHRQSGFSDIIYSDILTQAPLFQALQKDIETLLIPE